MRHIARACTVLALVAAVAVGLTRAARAGEAPFVVSASTGPAAGANITATVTRTVGGASVTLPAALVPALEPGDVVDAGFPDYRRPPSSVNYHVNVAFITETAPQHWLFARSGPADQLFASRPAGKQRAPVALGGRIHFVYGSGIERGIPIFTIIPEDAKTRGVDGVRDYVDAHPTDFVDMAESTDEAVDRYSYLRDFLTSLAGGAIDPTTTRSRVESAAASLGVAPATIDACYTAGGSTADVRNCVQQSIDGVVLQTNFAAPTQAQFLGGVVGAAEPLALAPYVSSLLTVWKLFVHTGHLEYEYLPATISLADPAGARHDELLMGLKVPTIRPPAALSDVLFFTIGDPQASEYAPAVIDDAPSGGVCERADRFSVPLHLDHTSRYVNDTGLVVAPDGHAPYVIPLDPRALDAPIVDRTRFVGSADGAYTVSLRGDFGFDPILQPVRTTMRLAVPTDAPWRVAAVPDHAPLAGGTLDVIASSPDAACLSRAELKIGSAPPVALTATALDDQRVELHGSLSGLPAGPAQIHFFEDDPRTRRSLESGVALAIGEPPAAVDPRSAIMSLGDGFVHLAGAGFERIRGLVVDGIAYAKEPDASATAACFAGAPPAGSSLAVGQHVTAQFVSADGSPGQVFPLTIAPPRPAPADARLTGASQTTHLSTASLTVMLDEQSGALPRQFAVRVRSAGAAARTPCADMQPDATAVTLPDGDVQARSPRLAAVSFRADALHDRAFGTLELQIVDLASGLGSAWSAIPGTFVRAPDVSQIACSADATTACRLYGANLATIDAVADTSGAFAPPGTDCPPTDKGVACVYVPRTAHYTLRLVDGATIETLPDNLITR